MNQENLPLISIIIPCKNRVRCIRHCMDSLVHQDYPNFEVLIQDGASTDGTLEILREYEEKYPKIVQLKSEVDEGFPEAFLKLLDQAKGTLIGLCLSDQVYFPNVLRWASQVYQKNPEYAFFGGKLYLTDPQWNITDYFHQASDNPKLFLAYNKRGLISDCGFVQKKYLDQVRSELRIDHSPEHQILVQFFGRNFPVKYFSKYPVGKAIYAPNHDNNTKTLYIPSKKSGIKNIRSIFDKPYLDPSFRKLKGRANIGILNQLIKDCIYIPLSGKAPLEVYQFLLEEIETTFDSIETKKEYKLFEKEIIRLASFPHLFMKAFRQLDKFHSDKIQKIFSLVHRPFNQFKIILFKIYYRKRSLILKPWEIFEILSETINQKKFF